MRTDSNRRPAGRSRVWGVVFAAVVLVAGCRGEAALRERLVALDLPSFAGLDPAARAELESRSSRVGELRADPSSPTPELALAYGRLGRLLDAHEIDDAAVRCYRNAAILAPRAVEWPYLRGQVALARGDGPAATEAFAAALELEPERPLVLLGAARAAALESRFDDSLRLAERALGKDPGSAFAWSVRAAALAGAGDHASAAAAYENALRLQPEATRLHGLLATELAKAGDATRARIEESRRGDVVVGVDDPWLRQVAAERRDAAWLKQEGERAFQAGDLAAALELLPAAVAAAPDDPDARVDLGSALARAGRWDEARAAYLDALRLQPEHALAHFNLGVVLARSGAVEQALDHYRSALARDPTLDDARQNLANALRRRGDCASAETEYRTLLDRQPGRAQAAAGLAACLAKRSGSAAGLATIDRALQTTPSDSTLLLMRARLLAAAPEKDVRDGAQAVALVQVLLGAVSSPLVLETAAMAQAEVGDFAGAIERQSAALAAARAAGMSAAFLSRLEHSLDGYRRGEPCRNPALD